tara:strand:+ start:2139 stop:2432 length:294 start_codon:yes stop_codon:yes gene_type:complete
MGICKRIPCKRSNFGEYKLSDNVIPFPQQMTNEEVELLAIEKEIEAVNKKVRELSINLENATNYLKELVDEHEVYKDAVENGTRVFAFHDEDDDWED